jgi:hexosaminidase
MPRALAVAVSVTLAAAASPAVAAPANRPPSIPAIRSFEPASGAWAPGRQVAVVTNDRRLRQEAATLARDLRLLLGRPVRRGAGPPRPGDVLIERVGRMGREGYELRIGATFAIRASTGAGVFYGGRTLLQWLRARRAVPGGRALDRPRYPERGLMLDLGRRPYPLRFLMARIRELGDLKLNLLHLHLTDDERWGIESDSHPELVTPGALTKRQLRDLLRFAARHHVEVVPEIDMPAHSGRILAAHPRLALTDPAGAPPPDAWRDLDITKPAARRLVRDILEEYLPLFGGRYWHVGGDEYLPPGRYADYPQLAAYARQRYGPEAGAQDTINGFFNWVDRIVRAHGKRLRAWSDQVAPGAAVQVNGDILLEWWTGVSPLSLFRTQTPRELLAQGHRLMNAGWFPTYYAEAGGAIEGRPDPAAAYEGWAPNRFCSPRAAGAFVLPCERIGARDDRMVGSKVNVWGNADTSLEQIATDLFPRLRVIAQKTWGSPPLTPSYAAFARVMRLVAPTRRRP